MQMPSEARLQAAAHTLHQPSGFKDALQRFMFPHLDLKHVVLFASTCRGWRQLVTELALNQLSEKAQQVVLPPGLTSTCSLLDLVKQQAQLLGQLQGRQSYFPRIQRLSFNDECLLDEQQAAATQHRSGQRPPLCFQELTWSPCVSLENASRWLVLDPSPGSRREPIVLDTEANEQVGLEQQGSAPIMRCPAYRQSPELHATWLAGARLLFHPLYKHCASPFKPAGICSADLRSQSISAIQLPEAKHAGNSHFFTVTSTTGSVTNILCWVATAVASKRPADQIIAYDVSSSKALYRLGCPEQILEGFLQLHSKELSPGLSGAHRQKGKDWAIRVHDLQLAPDGKLLMVVWLLAVCRDRGKPNASLAETLFMGLSSHDPMRGDLQYSRILTQGMNVDAMWDCQPAWLPCSSNVMYTSSDGGLHLMTSSGRMLWSSARADRCPDLMIDETRQSATRWRFTRPHASPDGRWILVMDVRDETRDEDSVLEDLEECTGAVSLVEASTGRHLGGYRSQRPFESMQVQWSMSGELCLVPELDLGWACHSTAPATSRSHFLELRDLSMPAEEYHPSFLNSCVSMSPSGSTIVGLEGPASAYTHIRTPGLQHWHIPAALDAIVGRASSTQRLQASSCAELTVHQPEMWGLAWHPLPSACMYAICDWEGGLHLVDAKANSCIMSWSEDELHGPATRPHLAQNKHDGSSDEGDENESEAIQHVLTWSQDGPMRTNLSSCLGLIHNGQNHSTNRLLIFVPHEGTHGTMCLIKQLRMVRPKITKMRAIKEAMPLIPNSPCGAEGASAQMPWHSWPVKPALLNWQSM